TPAPLLVASSFSVSKTAAAVGDEITVNYTLQNRGGAEALATTATLLLSADNRFLSNVTLPLDDVSKLAAGKETSGHFTFKLGDTAPLPDLHASQDLFLGLRLGTTNPGSPEQGNDWASLRLLTAETDA